MGAYRFNEKLSFQMDLPTAATEDQEEISTSKQHKAKPRYIKSHADDLPALVEDVMDREALEVVHVAKTSS